MLLFEPAFLFYSLLLQYFLGLNTLILSCYRNGRRRLSFKNICEWKRLASHTSVVWGAWLALLPIPGFWDGHPDAAGGHGEGTLGPSSALGVHVMSAELARAALLSPSDLPVPL